MGKEKYPVYYVEPTDDKGHTNDVIYQKIASQESPAGKTIVLGPAFGLPDYHKVWMVSKSFYYNFLKKRKKNSGWNSRFSWSTKGER